MNFDALQAVAEAASYGVVYSGGATALLDVPDAGFCEAYAGTAANARHIATFDPPTVLALIRIAKAAQAYRVARDNPRAGASATEERSDAWAELCRVLDAASSGTGRKEA